MRSKSVSKPHFLITLALSLAVHAPLTAQKYFDVASATAGATGGDNRSQDGATTVMYGNITAKAPLVQDNGDVYLVGVTSQWQRMQSSGSASIAPSLTADKRFSYGFTGVIAGYVHPVNENIKLNLIAIPYISNDYASISSDDLRGDLIALFAHKKNETLSFKYGLLYINGFAGNLFWPLLGAEWAMSDRSTLSVFVPQYVRYKYQATTRFDIGINIQTQISTYRMSPQRQSAYLEQQLGLAAAAAGMFITKNIYLQAFAGYSVQRFANFYYKDDRYDYKIGLFASNERTKLSNGYHNGPVGELKLSYLVPTN